MNVLNYIGSKNTLFNTLLFVCNENITDMKNKTFMDLFAGTGVVGFNMMDHFKNCSANDLEQYSFIINSALLKCNFTQNIAQIIDKCNNLDIVEGLIFLNYSPSIHSERMFFTNENAKIADAIRLYIQQLFQENIITQNEFNFLLASLIVSIDKVANTSCVYGAYLKQYKKTSLKKLILKPIHTKINITENNNVYLGLAEQFANIDSNYYDVIYLDPPYNQRQYSGNYSPLNYIALYDSTIVLEGKTALIKNYNKSNFCKKTQVKNTFIQLINGLKCNYLILSYNNEGLLSIDELKEILIQKGKVKLYKIQYAKFKAQSKIDTKFVEEYLWVVDTTKSNSNLEIIHINLIK